MADKFKIDTISSKCMTCNEVTPVLDNLECFFCKGIFHATCPTMSDQEKVGTKSMVNSFNRASTKKNFKFFCDVCLTKFEIDLATDDSRRLNKVEENMSEVMNELRDIKKMLKEKANSNERNNKEDSQKVNNIWFDKARLESTKVPPSSGSMLILNNSQGTSETVEKAIVENNISVTKSFKNTSGNLVVVCDTTNSRDQLQQIIESTTDNVTVKPVKKKKPSVTNVGLSREYTKEEVTKLLINQHSPIKQFSTVNNINEHFEIHDMKPTKANQNVHQVFASVSEVLRDGLRKYEDKVILGLIKCKIYDRFHVKRCNNCQGLGHYYKECPTPQDTCCANCSQKHPTNTCNITEMKCINCTKLKKPADHAAFDPKCPCLVEMIEKKKDLNLKWKKMEYK